MDLLRVSTSRLTAPDPNRCRCGASIPWTWSDELEDWSSPSVLCPACWDALRVEEAGIEGERLVAGANLPARYRAFSLRRTCVAGPGEAFAAFADRLAPGVLGVTEWNRRLVAELRQWTPDRSIYLCGPVGGGKTTLAAALVGDQARSGVASLYLPESDLWEWMRAEWRGRAGGPSLIVRLAGVQVLVFDDLGSTEQLHEWQRDALETLVGRRYNAGMPLICTSNLTIPMLSDRYGERVASRLAEMCSRRQVLLRGFDWRTLSLHRED